MKRIFRQGFLLISLLSLLFVSLSCDAPLLPRFGRRNFVWSYYYPATDFHHIVKAWYWEIDGSFYAILQYKGAGLAMGNRESIVVCMNEGDKNLELKEGMAISTIPPALKIEPILKVEAISAQCFIANRVKDNRLRLVYNKSIITDPEKEKPCGSNLAFDVIAKKNRRQTVNLLKELLPYMEETPQADPVRECLTAILE